MIGFNFFANGGALSPSQVTPTVKPAATLKSLGLYSSNSGRAALPSTKGALISIKMDQAGLTAKFGFKRMEVIRLYAENIGSHEAKALNALGIKAVDMVRKRMIHGKQPDGQDFAPLSTKDGKRSYASKKQYAITKGLIKNPTGSVLPPKSNLFVTGRLRNALYHRMTGGKHVGIDITMSRHKGLAELLDSGSGRLPARPFLTLNGREQEILTNAFTRSIRAGKLQQLLDSRTL